VPCARAAIAVCWLRRFRCTHNPNGFRATRDVTSATGNDLSQIARALEKCGDYRVLRRLVPRDVMTPVPVDEQIKIGVLLDVETTGLDAKTDEVIELGMFKFAYCPDGRVAHVIAITSAH
jgi:DNA polymerase III epsilon subunit-like protein